ncbi:hypothetical protein DFH09DRAFT_1439990 [Mycena vulgaris]|nr:hypothetical protein DFH09DRAFT_1439990 [Mycena vulgaris]
MPSRCSECGSPFPNPPTEGSDPTIDVPVAPGTLARHQELLCTNAAPAGPELPYIQAIVSKTGARLADVEAEISRLRLLLQQLEDERASLSRYHTPNKAILSPLRRMPPEVLSQIFSWTSPRSSRHILALQKFDLINSPWVLTHVSRRWKAVAISTSSLWSLVVINWFRNKADPLSLVKVHIERAQTLEIHFYGGLKGIPPRQIEIFRALAEHSPKWVEFHAQLNTDILPLLASIRHRVPALRRLWMQWAEPAASQAGVLSIDCFQMAPSLLDVTVLNPSLSVHLPAHQLTRYNTLASWEVHCQILKLGKSLVQARIVLSDGEPSGSDEMVESSMLRRLSISHPSILCHLTAPAVEDITFYLRTHEGPEALLSHLDPFVVRSDCTLRRLCLQGTPAAHTPAGILHKYPSISELVIITDHVQNDWNVTYEAGNAIISQLTIPNPTGGATVAPQLSKIYFGCALESYIDYRLYLQMLRSRWKTEGGALKSAALFTETGPKPDPETLNGLDMLCRNGLDLVLLEGRAARDFIEYCTVSL